MNALALKIGVFFLCLVVVFGIVVPGYCQDDPFTNPENLENELAEEFAWLKAETFVITASRVLEEIKKSAASITVVTDSQIQQMGARNLVDVLQTIPGFSTIYATNGVYQLDSRGIRTAVGQHVLIMINSHPVNENYYGGAMVMYAESLINNIKRIEVIRGPGSALYGANAFAGIVNIITQTADDMNGVQVSATGGSFQTQQYNLLFGKTINDFAINFNFNYFDTDGYDAYIEHDSVAGTEQLLSQLYGIPPGASLAPGDVTDQKERYNAMLTLGYNSFKLEGRYIRRTVELPLSLLSAITEKNENINSHYYLALHYEDKVRDDLRLSGKLYRNYNADESDYQAYPPGMPFITPDGLAFASADGLVGRPERKDMRTGGELTAVYTPIDANTIVAGLTYEKMEQFDVLYASNVLYAPVQNVLIPLPAIQDISDIQNYAQDADRTFQAAFIEDLWDVRENLRLTFGGRYDNYSDFGGSFNPRAGLAWEFTDGYDLKLLYGKAFRAPSFYELYSQNNPSILGNTELAPETVQTYEISVGATLTSSFNSRITGFRNSYEDGIRLVEKITTGTQLFQNAGELRTQGVEAELKYDFGKGIYLVANYTFQDTEELNTGLQLPNVPQHKGNILANIRLSRNFNMNTSLHFQGDTKRSEGDIRGDHDGFSVVNTTLIAKNFIEGLEFRASVYNVLDTEYTSPTSPQVPGDYPQPGRSFRVELRYDLPL